MLNEGFVMLSNITPKVIIEIIILTIVILVGYNYLKKFLFNKIKLNKWLILSISILLWAIPPIIKYSFKNISIAYWPYIFYIFSILLFLWFIDLTGLRKKNDENTVTYNKPDNKKEMINKPKPKPNRAKK